MGVRMCVYMRVRMCVSVCSYVCCTCERGLVAMANEAWLLWRLKSGCYGDDPPDTWRYFPALSSKEKSLTECSNTCCVVVLLWLLWFLCCCCCCVVVLLWLLWLLWLSEK